MVTGKRTKRTNGEGSVFADAERGGYIGLLYLDGRRRKVRAKTRTDALAKLAVLQREAASGVVSDGTMTVGQLLDLWRERTLANRDLAPSAGDTYAWSLGLLRAEFGTVRLRQLDVERIEHGLDAIATGTQGASRGKPLARRSIKHMRSTLAQALDLGVRRKLIASNPARLAEITPTATPPKPRRSLTPDEAAVLWAELDGERLGNLFKLMLTTGLRPGEALGLCWDAVDLDAAWLNVRRTVRQERGRAVVSDTVKTASSYRTIGLPEPAVEVLRAQRRMAAEAKLAAKVWTRSDHHLVFPTNVGTPWDLSNVRDELTRVCARAGIQRVVPHELRHSCASILSDQGVPIEAIADLLGHVDATMLLRTYRHRLRPSADAAVAVMGRMFGGAGV